MAPCRMDRLRLGMMRSSSTFMKMPRPVHLSQAPWGLLKENSRGVSSLIETPCSGQAKFWLKVMVSPPITSTSATPPVRLRAVSRLSARRLRTPSRMTRRSTTTSTVCLMFFSRVISSSRS